MFDRAALLALLLVTASLTGCTGLLASDADELRDEAREAARELDTPQAALEAGYEPEVFCSPDEGVHWVNGDLLDEELDPSEPEALLFLPTTRSVEASLDDEQRFLGVAYMVPMDEDDAQPPALAGVELDGPKPGASLLGPSRAELHVYLNDELTEELGEDPFPHSISAIDCPDGTTPPETYDEPAHGTEGETASCSEVLTGQQTHEHARVEIYLQSEEPFDLSQERYQLADRRIHFEAGERDAGGAIVHLHEAGATMGCVLETLGWDVTSDRLVLDTGESYEAGPERPFEVFVDGERSPEGFDTPLEHERTYVLRYDSPVAPTPCPNADGQQIHEHAQLDVRLNSSEPWDFSPDRYQHQAGFVALEDGPEDADGARIHVHQDRPTLDCLFATLGWETAEHRIETDTGAVYEATNEAPIEVLVNGEPVEDGFDVPIQRAHTYEIRYNASPPADDASEGEG